MIVAVTGHRPGKIGGYAQHARQRIAIRHELAGVLRDLRPDSAITGMALGVDQDFAVVCRDLGIPFVAAVPFVGQESTWPPAAQQAYRELIALATEVVVVTPGEYVAWKMQARNQWMVDHCDHLIAVWDGSSGGTANCVNYAQVVNRPTTFIDPRVLGLLERTV